MKVQEAEHIQCSLNKLEAASMLLTFSFNGTLVTVAGGINGSELGSLRDQRITRIIEVAQIAQPACL